MPIEPTRSLGPNPPSTDTALTAGVFGRPGAPALPLRSSADRYEVLDEIARGGMGIVYAAHDGVLNREVAVKTLRDRFDPGSEVGRRFVAEAKITGQLQHPGIPAVHDLGALPDGRPFLAMKLIKGHTLAELLRQRADTTADSGRFVAAFEQVCQAVGYAHAHDVIHRDLKPHNVMVGAFGEVQVMDWGLAKVLTDRAGPDAVPTAEGSTDGVTEIRSERDDGSATQAGSVMGTPAYMPPEQAIGAVDQTDRRSDVFGLGAILCQVLTGQPPYVGPDAETTRQQAARARLSEALARLDGCGADPDLVALCKRCLSPEPADRPADAGEVARAVAGLRAAADERARQAELDRARAGEQRKRRRVQRVLAAAVALLVAAGGAFAWWQDRQATARRVEAENRAREERTRLDRNADALDVLLTACAEALRAGDADRADAALMEVERRFGEGGGDRLRGRLDARRADLAVLRDLDAVDQFRWTVTADRWQSGAVLAAQLRAAFRRFGAEPGEAAPDEVAGRVVGSAVRERLVGALDLWLGAEKSAGVRAVLRAADPDPYRDAVRDAVLAGDGAGVAELAGRAGAGVSRAADGHGQHVPI